MKKIYFLEGDIGAGKTELINILKYRGYDIKLEPVQHLQDNGLLEAFYRDPKKYALLMQNTMFILKMEIINNIEIDIIFIERSPFCDKECFATLLHEDGFIDDIEWSTYNLWYNKLIKQMDNIDYKFIYLKDILNPPPSLSDIQKNENFMVVNSHFVFKFTTSASEKINFSFKNARISNN